MVNHRLHLRALHVSGRLRLRECPALEGPSGSGPSSLLAVHAASTSDQPWQDRRLVGLVSHQSTPLPHLVPRRLLRGECAAPGVLRASWAALRRRNWCLRLALLSRDVQARGRGGSGGALAEGRAIPVTSLPCPNCNALSISGKIQTCATRQRLRSTLRREGRAHAPTYAVRTTGAGTGRAATLGC